MRIVIKRSAAQLDLTKMANRPRRMLTTLQAVQEVYRDLDSEDDFDDDDNSPDWNGNFDLDSNSDHDQENQDQEEEQADEEEGKHSI